MRTSLVEWLAPYCRDITSARLPSAMVILMVRVSGKEGGKRNVSLGCEVIYICYRAVRRGRTTNLPETFSEQAGKPWKRRAPGKYHHASPLLSYQAGKDFAALVVVRDASPSFYPSTYKGRHPIGTSLESRAGHSLPQLPCFGTICFY